MNIVTSALSRPVTVLVLAAGVALAGALALGRMKADIFPALNLPVIYVCQPYGGMDPQQMEGLIANYYEYHFLYVNGIHHVESKNVQGMSLMKLYFHPGTDMAQAMGETVGYVNRSRAFMPPGTVNPFIMRFDTGSVPVGYLVLSSETRSVGEIQDKALFRVRPMFAAIEGVSAPPPFGGSQRTVVVRADPERLQAYGLSADDVVKKLTEGNTIAPSGQIRDETRMPLVPSNAMVVRPDELGTIEVKPGVFLQDVVRRDPVTGRPLIDDASDVPTGYALVNGKRAVYILVTKRASASTLDVVRNVRANLPQMQAELPDDIRVSFELDQSPVVTASMKAVAYEGLLAAGLVGLMVLLFLRDWRSVVVVVLNIPFALVAAVVALWLTGQTLNLMTLGGLALAVGVLVDESTVAVENVHVQMTRTPSVALAAWRGVTETAVPRLLAMLCVLAVFIPAFVMEGAARGLFLPLALAVGFAMIASYVLSGTLVPVLCVWLLKSKHTAAAERPPGWYGRAVGGLVAGRWVLVPAYLVLAGGALALLVPQVGTDIFPRVDAGAFQLRLRAPTGTRIEQTEAITQEALRYIGEEAKAAGGEVDITLGYVGVVASSYPINAVYLWMGGPHESAVRVALKPGSVRVDDLTARLREKLPAHLEAWTAARWKAQGVPADVAERRAKEIRLSFEPADIVNEVMSFGSPTPVEVQVAGANMAASRAYAEKLAAELGKVPALKDVQFAQPLDYPTVEVTVDRRKLAASGSTAADVARAVTPYTSSSRFTVPNFWRDPASGIGYQVQVEVPFALVKSGKDLEVVPVSGAVLLRDVGSVKDGVMPGEIDRYNMKRVVSLTANVQGADLGTVAKDVDAAVKAAGDAPKGVAVDVRGQITPFRELFRGLGFGLAVAVVAVGLMLVAYYQSLRLALVAVAPVPAVLAGVAAALLLTGSTLNLQSFTGAIMAVGVATANAILLVTFAERRRAGGLPGPEAGAAAARERARPILMTAAAMTAGMIPMALGGDQTAPLGRAVVGGLVAGTLTTLFVLPAAFGLAMGRRPARSASRNPFDPASPVYVPGVQEPGHAT
ncbi:efflux RND transporter permease subunit [Urbifossiella limnaea]|uniref:Multidrug resistance protein MdtC n=1 Tax=Urbifossiella limnaea TaxID=2528023 RepID=A0A517XLW0_9BACT|nr:efflux RND transporter permease subunit [Urbifossiella limnaea]QDU18500.1 Multidrug resistance protein MdtC [Urbifossiella limnaea]